jgi:tripartite-type tricarboxylate transporter receptor subunit TctC
MPRACMRILAGVLLACGLATPLHAEDVASYPSKLIKVIVPQSPGGGTDVACRLIAEAAERHLGQRLVVENKPGAGGRIGAALVARSAPDGYTLLYTPKPPLTIHQHLTLKLDFDPERDFAPVAIMTWAPGFLIVRSSFPARSVQEFVAYARQNPGKVTFGIQGIGAEFHVSLELLRQRAGISLVAVPYAGGAPAIVDLLAGRLDAMILVPAATKEHIAAGRLVPLATLEAERVADFPDVPTVAEAGLPELTGSPWFGFVAPAATPRAIIDKLAGVFSRLQSDAALIKRLGDVGYRLKVAGPDESAAIIDRERREFGKIAAGGRLEKPN